MAVLGGFWRLLAALGFWLLAVFAAFAGFGWFLAALGGFWVLVAFDLAFGALGSFIFGSAWLRCLSWKLQGLQDKIR